MQKITSIKRVIGYLRVRASQGVAVPHLLSNSGHGNATTSEKGTLPMRFLRVLVISLTMLSLALVSARGEHRHNTGAATVSVHHDDHDAVAADHHLHASVGTPCPSHGHDGKCCGTQCCGPGGFMLAAVDAASTRLPYGASPIIVVDDPRENGVHARLLLKPPITV